MGRLVLVGVDSGATKTEAAGVDASDRRCAFATEGPSNPAVVGIERACAAISRAVRRVLEGLGAEGAEPYIVAVGAAGVAGGRGADALRDRLAGLLGVPADRVVVFEDALAAHASVFLLEDGVVGVLGTGSCVYGVRSGRSVRLGGWGHLLGDEGSGYRLGVRTLREALECLDGLRECSDLAALVTGAMGFGSTSDLLSFVYYSDNPKTAIASAATVLMDACRRGSATAIGILEDELGRFAEQVAAAVRRLGTPFVAVGFTGSVYSENRGMLRDLLKRRLEGMLGVGLELREQRVRASCGAMVAGLRLRGDAAVLPNALRVVEECCRCGTGSPQVRDGAGRGDPRPEGVTWPCGALL